MTCRHGDDELGFKTNKECSSYEEPAKRIKVIERYLKKLRKEAGEPDAPDNSQFEIEELEAVGEYLVLRVRYVSCERCVGEAQKVMVIKATVLEATKWRVIDPHFQLPRDVEINRPATVAPPPLARFMPDEKGWKEAKDYASRLGRRTR